MPTFDVVPIQEARLKTGTPAPKEGGWVYYIQGDGTPFQTVHEALLAYGVPQAEIDAHKYWNRWDRLPKRLREVITREASCKPLES